LKQYITSKQGRQQRQGSTTAIKRNKEDGGGRKRSKFFLYGMKMKQDT